MHVSLASVLVLLHMVSHEQAELELLVEFASGMKTYQQLDRDARRFGMDSLIHTNPRRGIGKEMKTEQERNIAEESENGGQTR